MFRKEIKFIYDFNLSQIRKLGSYLTFEQIKQTEIHPAILHYISAEIDYLIFEDRQKILKDSIFDYSGELISGYFNQIAEEIKKNKRFSIEFIAQLILHSSSFTVNYLARPRWALMKLIFEDDEHKSTTEIKQILNYVYYYGYLKKIVISYINRKKILSLDYDEFRDLLNKIDDLGFKSDYRVILNTALQSMANFFNIGETHKNMIPLQSVELFLREKGLNVHLMKLRENFPQDEKLVFDIRDYQKAFNTVRYEDSEEVEDVDKDLVEDENTTTTEEKEVMEQEEEIESANSILDNSSKIKLNNLFGAPIVEESTKEESESVVEDVTSETESIPEEEKEEVVESWSEEAADKESGKQSEDELVAIPDKQIDIEKQNEEEKEEIEKQTAYEKTDEKESVVDESEHSKPEEIEEITNEKSESVEPASDYKDDESSEKSKEVIEISESDFETESDSNGIIDDESEKEIILEVIEDEDEQEGEHEEEVKPAGDLNEDLEEEPKPSEELKEELKVEIKPVEDLKEDLEEEVKPSEEPKEELEEEIKPVEDLKEDLEEETKPSEEPKEEHEEEIKPVEDLKEDLEEETKPSEELKEELEEEIKPVEDLKEDLEEETKPIDEPKAELKDALDFVVDNSQIENDVDKDADKFSGTVDEVEDSENKITMDEKRYDASIIEESLPESEKIITDEPTLFETQDKNGKKAISENTALSDDEENTDVGEENESIAGKVELNGEAINQFSESEFVEDDKPESETEVEDESDKVSKDKEPEPSPDKQISNLIKSETEDLNKSKSVIQKNKFEISELLERKNMTKVIDVIFDYDIEEFANVIDNACHCENINQAIKVLDKIYERNQISPSSKEAKTLKSVISDFFDRKEN